MADKGRKYHRSNEGKKVRVDLRRNKQTRARQQNVTHEMLSDTDTAADVRKSERVTGRGSLSRRGLWLAWMAAEMSCCEWSLRKDAGEAGFPVS